MVDINTLDYGDYVSADGKLYVVYGTDYKNHTASLVSIELLDQCAHDEEQMEANTVVVPVRKIEKVAPVHVDKSVIQAFFRLEVTPWALVAENKYPFSHSTGKYDVTEDDLLCFLDKLKNINSDLFLMEWDNCFNSPDLTSFARWPKQTEPGFSFYFLCTQVRNMIDWIDSETLSDDWSYIYELRDGYLKSKGHPIADAVIPDEFKGDLLADIEQYAERHEITDDIRANYETLLEEVATIDGEYGLKHKAYAYYGGNRVVSCDWKKSEEALLQAFDIAGDPYVANSLGYIYYSDRLGKPDYNKAFYYFNYASSYGVIEATYKLSDLYRHGHGTDQNPEEAWHLLSVLYNHTDKRHITKGKYPDICLRIGYCYRDGIGVDKDLTKAMEFFEKAKKGITARIKKNKGFGDEQVLKNILCAIEEVEKNL